MNSPIPVAARVYRRSLAGIVGSNPAGGMMSVSCECCVLSELSASGWSIVQRNPTECGVSECDHEASITRRPWPTRDCCAMQMYVWTQTPNNAFFILHTYIRPALIPRSQAQTQFPNIHTDTCTRGCFLSRIVVQWKGKSDFSDTRGSRIFTVTQFVVKYWKRHIRPFKSVPTRRVGSRYKLPAPGSPEGGPGPDYVAYVFVFLGSIIVCRVYKLTLSDQAQITLPLTVSFCDLV
jgi:hypothetical protein